MLGGWDISGLDLVCDFPHLGPHSTVNAIRTHKYVSSIHCSIFGGDVYTAILMRYFDNALVGQDLVLAFQMIVTSLEDHLAINKNDVVPMAVK